MPSPAGAVKELGRACGFDLVRVSQATVMHNERARYLEWIAAGRQAEMAWITRARAFRSTEPCAALPGARSVISVGMSYWGGHRREAGPNTGKIARYAWGRDYHQVMGDQLRDLAERLAETYGGEHRWYVDTGPAMDRALAVRSGLGWYGKNTNVLTDRFGSFVVLAEVITTVEFEPDKPVERGCGSCRLCVVACPTGAIGPEYTVDSGKCISYLTIEHRGVIPLEYRDLMGDWVFGCDICQDVCPPAMRPFLSAEAERRAWARGVRSTVGGGSVGVSIATPGTSESERPLFASGVRQSMDLIWLLRLSHEEYVEAFRGTAIKRAKVWMLRRNAAVALGNVGTPESIPPVGDAMTSDEHALVRGHAAWALGKLARRHGSDVARSRLEVALGREPDANVRQEIVRALEN